MTTHWFLAEDFRTRFPDVAMDDSKLFVTDGKLWTSAGMTAGIDQALAMLEEDLGTEIARKVSKNLIIPHRRADGAPPTTTLLDMNAKSSWVQNALA